MRAPCPTIPVESVVASVRPRRGTHVNGARRRAVTGPAPSYERCPRPSAEGAPDHCSEGRLRGGPTAIITGVNRATAWRDSWTATLRRAPPLPHNAVFISTLCVLAIAESLAELVAARGSIPRMFADTSQNAAQNGSPGGVQLAMVIGLLCLCTALPLALLRPVLAGFAVSAASFGSLTVFHTLTLAGFAAQLIAQYRLGRCGNVLAAMLFTTPFLALALAGSTDTDYRVRTVLLVALAPTAAFAGLARRARQGDREHNAIREVMAGSQWENAAREERARIVRELHDVVGHHVSMIAVQAETARVATPGMPRTRTGSGSSSRSPHDGRSLRPDDDRCRPAPDRSLGGSRRGGSLGIRRAGRRRRDAAHVRCIAACARQSDIAFREIRKHARGSRSLGRIREVRGI